MILTILRIQYLRLRNNPLELLLVFVMPVVFFSIFAAIFSKGIAIGNDKKLRLGWIDARQTALGDELRKFLEENSSLQCLPIGAATELASWPGGHKNDAVKHVSIDALVAEAQRSARYDLIVRLPSDFPDSLALNGDEPPCQVLLVTDGQNPMAVDVVSSMVKGFFSQKRAALVVQQIAALETSAQLSRRTTALGRDQPVRDQALEGTPSGSGQLESLKHFDSVIDPSKMLNRGVRFYDPQKERSRVFEESKLNDSPAVETRETLPGDSTSDNPVTTDSRLWHTTPKPGDPGRINESTLTSESVVDISVTNPQSASQANPRIAMYAAGIAVLFLLFSSTGNAAALLEESECGTLDRILIGKAGLLHVIGGKWLGIFILGCFQISVMFLWAELVFQIQLWNHLGGFTVMTVCTAAATSSFAMLLATLCNSRAQINAASVVVILSMSAVGGSMIPRFVMSDRMKEIGKWTFNAWALDGYQKVFWFQSPISSLRTEVTVLISSALLLGILSFLFSLRWKRG